MFDPLCILISFILFYLFLFRWRAGVQGIETKKMQILWGLALYFLITCIGTEKVKILATKIYDDQLTEYVLTKIIKNTEVVDSVVGYGTLGK